MPSPRKKSENRAARQAKTRIRPNSPVFTKKEAVQSRTEQYSGKEGGGATVDGARSAPGREAAL